MSKLIEPSKSFQQEIKKILMDDWDPIGVQAISEAQDEYDNYIPDIYSLLVAHKSVDEVFDFLFWVETEHIGLNGDRKNTLKVAEKLVELYNHTAHRLG